jgi:hypothetical protein
VSGSLAITYSDDDPRAPFPFFVNLRRIDPVHILDSHTLSLILAALDTFYDFVSYVDAKEAAIQCYDTLSYCGEEDLLAHYFLNFDRKAEKHFIGTKKKRINGFLSEKGPGFRSLMQSLTGARNKPTQSHTCGTI